MSSTPSPCLPPSPIQSEKAKRYDRQLRLWGDHGQSSLERASICLVNATATGTEILKSLVLPGLGSFTILDPALVSGEDAGSNFFLTGDSVGQSRGEVAARLLLEMNHEVRGDCRQDTVENILEADPDFLQSFTLVIACGCSDKTLSLLSSKLEAPKIPLMVVRNSGFFGYIRLQMSEHVIVETHPDDRTHDLRLDEPWPELANWLEAEGKRMEDMDLKDHSHTPYPVIIYRQLQKWMEDKKLKPPFTFKEKKLFKEEMMKGVRKNEINDNEYVDELEENFEEAGKAINTVLNKTTIPVATQTIIEDSLAENINSSSSNFWILAHALREFVKREERLPVSGIVPDMISDSERFIKLQNIYKDKANQDADVIGRKVSQVLDSLGRGSDTITDTEIRRFCKEARFLKVIRGSSLSKEFKSSNLSQYLENPDSDVLYYIVLRAVDQYMSQFDANPGIKKG